MYLFNGNYSCFFVNCIQYCCILGLFFGGFLGWIYDLDSGFKCFCYLFLGIVIIWKLFLCEDDIIFGLQFQVLCNGSYFIRDRRYDGYVFWFWVVDKVGIGRLKSLYGFKKVFQLDIEGLVFVFQGFDIGGFYCM